MLVAPLHHWWSGNGPLSLIYHLSPNYRYMRWCRDVHKGMDMSIHCFGSLFSCMHSVHSGTISVDQNSSSSGTVWKSSSSSSSRFKDSGELLLEMVGVSKLSSLKDRRHHNWILQDECVGVQVIDLHGGLCAGLKDAFSKLDT